MSNLLAYVVLAGAMAFGGWVFFSATNGLQTWQCKKTARKMALEYSWEFWTGCMVKTGGQWMPLGAVRSVAGVE